jgi:integrase
MNVIPHPAATGGAEAPRQIEKMRRAIRVRHYSIRAEEAYLGWIRRFFAFTRRHPKELSSDDINRFLTDLAVRGKVAASTQRQALSAILFLYREVLKVDPPWIDDLVRARQPKRLPTVLGREEVAALLARLEGAVQLVVILLYGTGMRILEYLRLRVQDVDFDLGTITIRNGKGRKDVKTTMIYTHVLNVSGGRGSPPPHLSTGPPLRPNRKPKRPASAKAVSFNARFSAAPRRKTLHSLGPES